MQKVLGVFIGLIVLMIAGIIAVFAFGATSAGEEQTSDPLSNAIEDVKNTAANAAIDTSGIKAKAEDILASNRDVIAAATGLTTSQVDEAVASLDIQNWTATSLPSTATATDTISGNYAGVDGTVTTYDDPGYVTVGAYGQSVTLAVPESAQPYIGLLEYIQ